MVAIYCRISGKKAEGKDVSIEDQEAQGIHFAARLGQPYKVYKDIGISGAKNEIEDRPEFAEMFSDMKKKSITSIFVIDQSRIERNSRIWQMFSYAILKYQCIFYIGGNLIDLDDEETRLSTGIISLTNEFFAKITSRKVKTANRLNAAKGKGHGITANGYKKDKDGYLVIDDIMVDTIRNIFKWSLEGIGTYTIAKKLNEAGVPTKSFQFAKKYIIRTDKYTGRKIKYPRSKVPWRGNVIYDMITNPIYKGDRHYGDVVAKIEGIISEELWDQVNKNLAKNKKNVGPKTKFHYLLNGFIFCAECGSDYRGKIKASGRNTTYYCKGKSQGKTCESKRGLNIPKFESFILNHLFESEELYKKLSNLKKDSDKEELLKEETHQLYKKKEEIDESQKHLYKLMLDPRIKDDVRDDYLRVKMDFEEITELIKKSEETLSMQSQVKRKARIDKIFGEFNYTLNFDEIKKSVHGIIESIQVQHLPEQKNFVVQINYRGFNKKSVFATDHNQMKWVNMSHHEVIPLTSEDKSEQDDLFDFLAKGKNWSKVELIDSLKHFNVWRDELESSTYPELLNEVKKLGHEGESVVNIETSNIVLNKEHIYNFNSNTS